MQPTFRYDEKLRRATITRWNGAIFTLSGVDRATADAFFTTFVAKGNQSAGERNDSLDHRMGDAAGALEGSHGGE